MSNNDVVCWGDNGIGQLGYGDTEDRGDGQTDLPFTTELALELDEEVVENSCNILGVPEQREELDRRLDSDSSDTGDLISMFEIPTTGCPAIAYYDSGSGNLKFAAYDNGMWSVETLGSDSSITEIDLVVDSNGIPHIFHLGQSSDFQYTTKENGIWSQNSMVIEGDRFSVSIDSSDVITFAPVFQSAAIEVIAKYTCSSSCGTSSNWNWANSISQDAISIETTDGHQVFIPDSQDGLYYRVDSLDPRILFLVKYHNLTPTW